MLNTNIDIRKPMTTAAPAPLSATRATSGTENIGPSNSITVGSACAITAGSACGAAPPARAPVVPNLNEAADLRGGQAVTSLPIGSLETTDAVSRITRTNVSSGRIYFWQGGSLWIGQGRGRTDWHRHRAHQLTVAPEGTFRFRTEETDSWESFEGALVPSLCPHQFELDGVELAHLFIEPESRAGGALTAIFGATSVGQFPTEDSRAAAAISESRLRHLFVAATGSSFRAYLLWLRINLAIEAVTAGASWTDAAHDAGFADSAHLTRSQLVPERPNSSGQAER